MNYKLLCLCVFCCCFVLFFYMDLIWESLRFFVQQKYIVMLITVRLLVVMSNVGSIVVFMI